MSLQKVWVDPSVDLANWSRWRLQSLLSGQIHHAFHYQSLQQSNLWLEVFRRHSPAASAQPVTTIYEHLAQELATRFQDQTVHVISLGCGDGRKDLLLLQALRKAGARVRWTPQDISLSLVLLTAASAEGLELEALDPVVADLQAIPKLAEVLDTIDATTPRLFTYFGLVPNFEPEFLRQSWSNLVRPNDHLLVSANLAPAQNESKASFLEATEQIQPQYDNPETERWLRAILQDWGLQERLGNYRIRLESRNDLLRLVAVMDWQESFTLTWEGHNIPLTRGDNLRLFFSYRYTPGRFRDLAQSAGLQSHGEWIAETREEGVWWLKAR